MADKLDKAPPAALNSTPDMDLVLEAVGGLAVAAEALVQMAVDCHGIAAEWAHRRMNRPRENNQRSAIVLGLGTVVGMTAVAAQSDWNMTRCLILEDDHRWIADDGGKDHFEEAYSPKEYGFAGLEGGIGVAVVFAAVSLIDLLHKKGRGHFEEHYEVEVCGSLQVSVSVF